MREGSLLVLGALFALLTGCAAADAAGPANVMEPLGVGMPPVEVWSVKPKVWVCEDSPFTVTAVQNALDAWASHGAPRLKAKEYGAICDADMLGKPGTVVVGRRVYWGEAEDDYWIDGAIGQTMVSDVTVPRTWAIIHFDYAQPVDFISLRHEVGHLWFDHVDDRRHLMYPARVPGGNWSWEGIDEAFESTPVYVK